VLILKSGTFPFHPVPIGAAVSRGAGLPQARVPLTQLSYRNWPGLTSPSHYVHVDHQDLAAVQVGLRREEARLGEVVASREALLAACVQEPFGAWYTARYLSWLDRAVCSIFVRGVHATRYNLREFGGRLAPVSVHYREAEDLIVRLLDQRDQINGWEINVRSPGSNWSRTDRAYDTPPRPYPRPEINPARSVHGDLAIPHVPLHPEIIEAYPAWQLAEWLKSLKAGRVWDAHLAGAEHISVVTKTLEELRAFLYRQAQLLERGWSDRASPLAQAKLQRIDATIGSSVDFGEAAAGLRQRLSRMLEDIFASMHSRDLSPGRFADQQLVSLFRVINENYRYAIEWYPRSWAFDLPFGGIEPPGAQAPDAQPPAPQLPPSGPPPVVPAREGPAGGRSSPFASLGYGDVPPVIGESRGR
jgi:hypothetical protein